MKRLAVLCSLIVCVLAAGKKTEPQSGIFLIKTDSLGNVEWERVYAEGEDCYGFGKPTSDGGYMVAGSIHHNNREDDYFWLAKTDSAGYILWEKRYGDEYESLPYQMIGSFDMIETDDSCWVVAVTQGRLLHEDYGLVILKINPQGEILWKQLITEGPASVNDILQTSDGNYIFAGEINFHPWVFSSDSKGDTLWSKVYGDGKEGIGTAELVQSTSDGGYLVGGWIVDDFESGKYEPWLVKTDSSGCVQVTYFNVDCGQKGRINSVTSDLSGDYILLGTNEVGVPQTPEIRDSLPEESLLSQLWIVKINRAFDTIDTIWVQTNKARRYNGVSIHPIFNSDYVILSVTQSDIGDFDICLLRIKSKDITVWSRTYGSNLDDLCLFFQQVSDKGYVLSGYRNNP